MGSKEEQTNQGLSVQAGFAAKQLMYYKLKPYFIIYQVKGIITAKILQYLSDHFSSAILQRQQKLTIITCGCFGGDQFQIVKRNFTINIFRGAMNLDTSEVLK